MESAEYVGIWIRRESTCHTNEIEFAEIICNILILVCFKCLALNEWGYLKKQNDIYGFIAKCR